MVLYEPTLKEIIDLIVTGKIKPQILNSNHGKRKQRRQKNRQEKRH